MGTVFILFLAYTLLWQVFHTSLHFDAALGVSWFLGAN
jgi:hypothetical protein